MSITYIPFLILSDFSYLVIVHSSCYHASLYLCTLLSALTMFDLQLWEALETYVKWFNYTGTPMPLWGAVLIIQHQSILVYLATLSLIYSFQIANAFLVHLTNMICFYHVFMHTQHPHHHSLITSPTC